MYLLKWNADPTSFWVDLVKSFGPRADKDFVDKALSSPNSFFIPLAEVTWAAGERDWVRGNSISISTTEMNFVLCEHTADNPNFIKDVLKGENRMKFFRSTLDPTREIKRWGTRITGNWQKDVLFQLQGAASRNRGP